MRDKEILKNIQVCSKCIYDITVPSIKFDEQGICNYCHMVDDLIDEYGTGKVKGQEIFQGTKNLGKEALIKVNNVGDETKLGKIILDVKKGWQQKPILIQKTDKLAKYFVATVSLLALSPYLLFK